MARYLILLPAPEQLAQEPEDLVFPHPDVEEH